MAPNQREQIQRLTAENAELKTTIALLTERLDKLGKAQEVHGAQNGESLIRLEAVEENLCQLATEQQELQHDQASLMLRLEAQQMYSRKQTLLLTGPAVCPPTRGEDIRGIVLGLLTRHLGLPGIQPNDICACHRLKNPRVILVRFVHMDHSDAVYRARTRPKMRGLLIFESLTSERLSVISALKSLKADGTSNIVSYFTQSGKIFVRTSEDKGVKPIEIPFGLDQGQIRMLCEGRKVEPSPTIVRDQFRAAYKKESQLPAIRYAASHGNENPWVYVGSKKHAPPVSSSDGPTRANSGFTQPDKSVPPSGESEAMTAPEAKGKTGSSSSAYCSPTSSAGSVVGHIGPTHAPDPAAETRVKQVV